MKNFELKTKLSCLALIAASSLTAVAQQGGAAPQSTKGAVIKGKAPISKDVLKVQFPKPVEMTLSNGVKVYILENHRLPQFSVNLVFKSGGLADEAVGTAQYTASLLREGTKTRSSKDIAEQIEGLGAALNAGTGLSTISTTVSASGLTDNFDKILDLLADVVKNPTFPDEEFTKLKQRSIASIRQQRSNPGFLASEKFNQILYGSHPAARSSVTAEDWAKLSPDVLRKFHAKHYIPSNAIFTLTGDVKPAEIVAKLEKAFAGWQGGAALTTEIPKVNDLPAKKIYLIDRPGSVQTNLMLGTLTIERTNPDYYALEVMNRIFGGGPAARLFLNLREDKGYTYGAYSNTSAYKYRGNLTATAEVRTDVTDGSMKEFMYELNRIRDEKVPEKELQDAKNSIVGIFALQLESPASVLNSFTQTKLYNLGDNYWNEYAANIAKIAPDDIQRVAKKYIDLEHLQIVAVGDGKKVIEVLKKYGTVEVFDTEGKPKDLNAAAPTAAAATDGKSADLAGAWNLNIKTPDGQELPLKGNFKVDAGKVTGALDSPMGEIKVNEGTVNGSDVTFKASADAGGQKLDLEFAGKISGNSIKGTIKGGPFPPMEVNGTKEK